MENSEKKQLVQGGGRLLSLDALRGFDMLWIIGGSTLIDVLAKLTGVTWLIKLSEQMHHVPWIGFHFYDLIFPLFMFIVGISITLSIRSKLLANVSQKELSVKAFKRMVILILLGILYNGVFRDGFADARYVSILGQIGVGYFFASLIIIFSKSFRTTVFWMFGILFFVTLMQLFVPVPGVGAGVLTPEGHMNGYLDRLYLPGKLTYGNGMYDALGYLSIVSAIGITLMGTFAGDILKRVNLSEKRKVATFAVIGVSLVVLALAISPFYPIIKGCWTTTYNLLAGGISFLLFALFYLVIDVWHYQKWSFYFRVIGMNSIFIYLFVHIVPVNSIIEFFIGWFAKPFGDGAGLVYAIGFLIGEWLLLYFMYKKKIFVKV